MFRVLLPCWIALAAGAAASAPEPIRIGEFASLTGKEAAYGRTVHQGTLLAVEEINAAGGVLGRPLRLLTEDDQSKPGEAATAVKKLLSRDQVVALLGEVASLRTLEAAPVAQHARRPLITPASVDAQVTAVGDYIFRVCFVDSFQGGVLARFARGRLGLRRVALLTSVSNAYSVGLTRIFREQFTAAGGVIVAEQKYAEGDRDFRAQLTAIKAAGAEAICHTGYYTEGALACVQARQLGLTGPILGGDGWDAPTLIELGGRAVEGTYFCTHYSPDNPSPEVQRFGARYLARWGEPPNAWAALGHDSVLVLADALRRAGTTAGPALRDALAATRDFPAVTGRITLDARRNAAKTAVILTVKDGRFVFVEAVAP